MTATEAGDWAKLLQAVPLSTGGLIVLIWLFHAFVTHGLSRLLEPMYFWRNRRRELLDSYLSMQAKGGELEGVASVVADKRDAIYFYEATGIEADRKWRLLLIKLYEGTSPSISWRTIKLARDRLVPDGEGGVALSSSRWIDVLLTVFLSIAGFNLVAMLAYCVLVLQSVTLKGTNDYATVFVVVLMLILAMYMFVTALLPVLATQKLRKELARQKG